MFCGRDAVCDYIRRWEKTRARSYSIDLLVCRYAAPGGNMHWKETLPRSNEIECQ